MIEPIGSRVLIKPKKMETTTRASLMVKKDDLVIFSKFAGTNITDNDESYLLIEERDILAKIHN